MKELRIEDLLQRARDISGKPSYICPACGNGSGRDGTGLTEDPGRPGKWHCFKCQFTGDVYDIADIVYHREKGESFKEARRADNAQNTHYTHIVHNMANNPVMRDTRTEEQKQKAGEAANRYIKACASAMRGSAGEEYLTRRGFDADFIELYRMGWDAQRKGVVIPYPGTDYYIIRFIDPQGERKYYKPPTEQAGPEPIFNTEALKEKGPLFVMEGQFDALSVMQAGGSAIAIGGGGQRKLESYAGPMPEDLIIIADNDAAGEQAARRIREALKKQNRTADIVRPPKQYKDANDILTGDPKLLHNLCRGFNWIEWERMTKATSRVDAFLQAVTTERYKPIETGFKPFDRITGGGLVRQSLVMLAAAPGQGKTTLAAQLFEGMAKQGQQVIFVNLEMSREQLIAKSLARHAYKMGYGDFSASDIMRGYSWTEEQAQAIKQAALDYKRDIAHNFTYADRDETTAQLDSIMDFLRSSARQAKRAGREAPVVVVDYLHIIQTADSKGREEEQAQAIKRSVIELKAFAIEYNTIVFAILATNREANRSKELTLYSGRDTSNIEYSADMFLTLQPEEKDGEDNPAILLRMEKNRMGEMGQKAAFYFDGKHGIFTEAAPDWIPEPHNIEPLETF